jgi:hypothetical protein
MDCDPVRWVQAAGAVIGAALLCLGIYIHAEPMMFIGGGVLLLSGLCVSCYKY